MKMRAVRNMTTWLTVALLATVAVDHVKGYQTRGLRYRYRQLQTSPMTAVVVRLCWRFAFVSMF